jgi:hypothetical protein
MRLVAPILWSLNVLTFAKYLEQQVTYGKWFFSPGSLLISGFVELVPLLCFLPWWEQPPGLELCTS